MPKGQVQYVDIEPKWADLCRAADRGAFAPIFLLKACEMADIVRQAQKSGKAGVIFHFDDDGTVRVEYILKEDGNG